MNHTEETCPELHEKLSYTVRVFDLNQGAKAFHAWYRDIFRNEHPGCAEDFDFLIQDDPVDGTKVLEVMQHNPFFSVNALEQMYSGYRTEKNLPKTLNA